MAKYESSSSNQVSSIDKNDYNQLLHDFEKLHCESNKIFVINNRLKGLNNWLKNRVNQLETEIVDLKVDFEHLDMIYNNSTCCSENQLIAKPYENCTLLENKIKYLIKTCARFTRGKANLDVVLGFQNCVFGRVGIGYNSFNEKKVKEFGNFFSKNVSSDISLTTYNYCMRKRAYF